jgi:hypothetical protein
MAPVRLRKIARAPAKHGPPRDALRLTQEIRSIQRRAAQSAARIVSIGPLLFFSTATGDAWMLGPAEQLAARLARDGDPLELHVE